MWVDFMREVIKLRPEYGGTRFQMPKGLTEITVDPETGMAAGAYCPMRETVVVPSTAAVPKQAQGVLEVIIDETGAVEQVLMRVPLNAAYDRQALLAAKSWLYQPAMMNGKPVKFRKAVQINVAR